VTDTLTAPEVARRLRVSPDKIVAWIKAGELQGFNVALRRNGRPRYRISLDALLDFERRRAGADSQPSARRRQSSISTIEYF